MIQRSVDPDWCLSGI